MNKVVFINAYFVPVGEEKEIVVDTGEKKSGFLGTETSITRKEKKWTQTGFSKSIIDTKRLTEDLNVTVENLNKEGYEVVTVTNVISGEFDYDNYSGTRTYGYGYSYTDGLMVVGRKASEEQP